MGVVNQEYQEEGNLEQIIQIAFSEYIQRVNELSQINQDLE